MTCTIASIRREFAALADDLAGLKANAFTELRAEVARHGETRLTAGGWWPIVRRRKTDKLNLIEARIERLRDVVSHMTKDEVDASKKRKEDARRRLGDLVRASPAR